MMVNISEEERKFLHNQCRRALITLDIMYSNEYENLSKEKLKKLINKFLDIK